MKFKELFKKNGYKFTKQREAVCDILADSKVKHLSVKDICDISKEKGYNLGIATIYRTLLIMKQLGIVRSFIKKEKVNKYELYELSAEDKIYKHIHFFCIKCGKVIEINKSLLDRDMTVKILKKYNFEVNSTQIEFYGICEQCKQKV